VGCIKRIWKLEDTSETQEELNAKADRENVSVGLYYWRRKPVQLYSIPVPAKQDLVTFECVCRTVQNDEKKEDLYNHIKGTSRAYQSG
jgi:hypothetical protein